ncbi:hypothetical protein CVS54_03362 [Microbacterium oxydans]|uniref:Uncharacterized protein n=2 Tax=Microbacterium TaxID=33882 RepID=A0A3S5HTE5_9MICO|nr:hypothetical protein CVS54_03362 [Microbacterium oxydans]
MRRPPGIHRSTATVDQPVIMRLITTVSLALLLLFAFAVTAHGDAGENGAAPSLAAAAIDAFDDTAAIGADAETDEAQAQAALPVAVTSTLVGAALCILGVLCGLAAMLLLSRVLGRPGQFSTLRETPRALRSDPASPLHPCGTAVSLIRLGLSRT